MPLSKKLTVVKNEKEIEKLTHQKAISDHAAEDSVRLLIEWIGENPNREGLKETPHRFIKAWKEFFKGYQEDPKKHLKKTIKDVGGYKGPITLQNIRVETYCEHHLVPFIGEAFISYIPKNKIVGLSKLVRLLDGYAKRMQIQERLTTQVATALYEELDALGVAVAIRSEHFCMSTRGAHKPGAQMLTVSCLGEFDRKEELRRDFMATVTARSSQSG